MAKLPSFQFYPGDWLKDPNLRACSLAARGAWVDILCLMHESEQRGVLRVNSRAISVKKLSKSIACCTPKLIQELVENGVVKVARRDGALYSKRLIKEELRRRHKAQSGRKGGKQTPSKPEANTQANPGSSSSSSSSSSLKEKETPSLPPSKVLWDGQNFTVPSEILAEYETRWPNVLCQAIEQEITDCAAYHADKGTKIESPRGRITTWLKNAFDKLQTTQPKPDALEQHHGKMLSEL